MIDTRLITFLTLMEEKSYTKTAKKLSFTQPAVTHHIKSLEKKFDISLFVDTKTFELTKAGKILLEYAKEMKMQNDLLNNNLKKQESTTPSKLGLTEMVSASLLGNKHLDFLGNGLVNCNTYIYSHTTIQDKILNGELDLGIIDNSFDSSVFESIYLSSSKIILVCKPDGKYQRERITREMLMSATIILGDRESGLFRATISALHSKNIKLRNNIVLESNNLPLLVNLVESNDAIGFVYEDSVLPYLESGKLKRIELLNFQPTQNFYLLYNRVTVLDEDTVKMLDKLKYYGEKQEW